MSQEENEARNSRIFYIIPDELLADENLSHTEMILYALLTGLSSAQGRCWASDEYLAKRMREPIRQVQKQLKKLDDLGYITRNTTRCPSNPFKRIRHIFVNISFKKCLPMASTDVTGAASTDVRDTSPAAVIVSEEKQEKEKINTYSPLKPPEEAPKRVPVPSEPVFVNFSPFVRMPEEEYRKLCEENGKEVIDNICQEINDYLASTGKKPYKDYAATVRNWIRRKKEMASKQPSPAFIPQGKIDRRMRDKNGNLRTTEYDDLF